METEKLIFPRNPERDEKGRAVLYPGMVNYEGVAAIFGAKELGEYIIMAPSVEALEAHVKRLDITDVLHSDRCRVVKMEKLP